MPAEPELCFECARPLSTDGAAWSCWPCGRHGYYDRGRCGDRLIVVRIVTQWRGEDGQVRHG